MASYWRTASATTRVSTLHARYRQSDELICFGEGLASVTRLLAADRYSPRPWVQYSTAITSAQGMKARLLALGMRLYGFGQMKVKVGIEGQDDAARLRIIRGWAGRKMDLRVDANEAWPADAAVERIRAARAAVNQSGEDVILTATGPGSVK